MMQGAVPDWLVYVLISLFWWSRKIVCKWGQFKCIFTISGRDCNKISNILSGGCYKTDASSLDWDPLVGRERLKASRVQDKWTGSRQAWHIYSSAQQPGLSVAVKGQDSSSLIRQCKVMWLYQPLYKLLKCYMNLSLTIICNIFYT